MYKVDYQAYVGPFMFNDEIDWSVWPIKTEIFDVAKIDSLAAHFNMDTTELVTLLDEYTEGNIDFLEYHIQNHEDVDTPAGQSCLINIVDIKLVQDVK